MGSEAETGEDAARAQGPVKECSRFVVACITLTHREGERGHSLHVAYVFSVITYLVLVYLVLLLHKYFLGSAKGQVPIIRLRGTETAKYKEHR